MVVRDTLTALTNVSHMCTLCYAVLIQVKYIYNSTQ